MTRLLVVGCLLASTAFGQEFELDLSEEKPKVPAELRASIAVISVLAADREEASLGRARALEAEVLKQLAQSEQYSSVLEPSGVAQALGEKAAAEFLSCEDYACFDAAAKALKVNRVVRFTVAKAGAGSLVSVYGFDPAITAVLLSTQDSGEKAEKTFLGLGGKSQAQKDREFLKKIAPFIKDSLTKLATANGKIVIDDNEQSAVATVDGVEAGSGSLEVIVQRGAHVVKVMAEGFLPFEQKVTIEPAQTQTVKVSLIAKPIELKPVVKVEEPSDSIFKRPGLYVAAGGAVVAGVGVVFGQLAASVVARESSGDVPVAVTRAEAKGAVTNALLANILVSVGAAMVVGGTTWILLTPTVRAPARKPSTEPTESTVTGAVLEFGGRF